MKDPAKAGRIVEAVVRAVDIPVTVKMRTGWDAEHKNAVEFARVLENSGAAAICVHGRTREQMYMPYAEYETIANVKSAVKIPVYGNGDVFFGEDAVRLFFETGVDGIMIGRGSLGTPWIFEEIKCLIEGRAYTPPNDREKIECALSHLRESIAHKGEIMGIKELRKQLSYYTKGMNGAAAVRDRINHTENYNEIETLFYELVNKE